MIVELIGPSGAGKTTVVGQLDSHNGLDALNIIDSKQLRALEDEAGWRRLRKYKGMSKIGKFLPFYWRDPSIAWPLLAFTILQGRPFRWRSANRALAALSFSRHIEQVYKNRTVILDEGFIQALWALSIGSKELRGKWLIHRIMTAYQRLIDPMGIVLNVHPAIAKSRAFSRQSKGRFNKNSSAGQQDQFDVALEHHRRIIALMPNGVIKATIDGTCSKTSVGQTLIRTIAGLTERREGVLGLTHALTA